MSPVTGSAPFKCGQQAQQYPQWHTHLYTVLTVEGKRVCNLRIKASISRWMLAFSGA